MRRRRLSRKDEFPYKVVQEGTLIGEVRDPANATDLIMFDSTKPAKLYKNGKLVGLVSRFRKLREGKVRETTVSHLP